MDFRAILERLAAAEVEFVVVGGVSAVLRGVPTTTFDLDIVHARDAGNRERLMKVLANLEACFREHLPKVLAPTAHHLDSDGHMLLMTSEGPLDVLGMVTGGRRFEDLALHSSQMDLGDGLRVRVLDLQTLIDIKQETGREKDLAQLPLLRRTLAELGDS